MDTLLKYVQYNSQIALRIQGQPPTILASQGGSCEAVKQLQKKGDSQGCSASHDDMQEKGHKLENRSESTKHPAPLISSIHYCNEMYQKGGSSVSANSSISLVNANSIVTTKHDPNPNLGDFQHEDIWNSGVFMYHSCSL